MVNGFMAVQLIAIAITMTALVLLIADDGGTREQKLMGYFLSGALIQNVGYLLELTAPTMEAAVWSVKMQYLGSVFVPICYCYFICSYCYTALPKRLYQILGAADFAVLAAVFSLEWHHVYYREQQWIEGQSGHFYLSLTYGWGYPVFLICGCAIPYVLSLVALIRALIMHPAQAASRKYGLVIFLSTFPMLALFAYAAKLTSPYDLTPASLGLSLSLVAILIWRRRTHDIKRLAADVLLGSMGDGVIVFDTQKKLLSYNQAALAAFPQLADLNPGDDMFGISDLFADMIEQNVNRTFCVNGRYYESHTKLLQDEKKVDQGYVVLILDVTETRNYIEEIERVREQAEKANRAKSEFLANMSHEIRTPMNAIIGLSEVIIEESRGRKLYSYACDIKSASQNLLVIINDILDLSKVEAGKMELVNADYHVKTMVNEVVHMMDIAASQRGLLMKHEFDMSIPCGYNGDQGRIKQILINLLNNAVKFTKEGSVRLSVGGRPKEEGVEELIFRVEDTGCGIREEDKEKIFENFKQVNSGGSRSAEGTGLGLSITRQLVLLMGGQIKVESVYGQGSVFTVTIPQRIVDGRTLLEAPDEVVQEVKRQETFVADDVDVLVVDDNRINRRVAKSFLETYRFRLTEAESGKQAIELVKNNKYDIIFMDHMMPEMDGIEATRIIRKECGENGDMPVVIALTANAMEGARDLFLKNGFQDYISKPLDRDDLNSMLLKWIPQERRRPPSEEDKKPAEEKPFGFEDIDIEGIDMEAVMRYQAGSVEDYVEILQLYCMDGAEKLKLLQRLFEERDYHNYGIEVHGLKSASANVGAMKLSAAAREQEEAADRKDEEFIASRFPGFIASYKALLAQIRQFLKEKQEKDAENAPGAAEPSDIGEEELKKQLSEALELLENYRSKECAKKLEELSEKKLAPHVAEAVSGMRGKLKLYEDDLVEEMLRALLGELA